MTRPRVLIVNADDFGLTAGVSRGILHASRDGIVTSTTLLVNQAQSPLGNDFNSIVTSERVAQTYAQLMAAYVGVP